MTESNRKRWARRAGATAALLLCGAAAALPGVASAAPRAHSSVGFEPGALSVAADAAGHVYLSDPRANGQIQKFTSGGSFVAAWGALGRSYSSPRDIATDADGNVYVADHRHGRLLVYSPDGALLRHWSLSARDVAVDAAGFVYAIGDFSVRKHAPNGSLVAEWGGRGSGDGQFGESWGVAAGPAGAVYVADTYGNRIQAFDADGGFVGSWGSYGSGAGQFRFPYGIAADADGSVYVADTANDRVQKFTSSGKFLRAWGGSGQGPGRFHTPTSVATDPAGYVYVADAAASYPSSGAARVQKFTPQGEFVSQWRAAPALPRPARPRLFAALGRKTARRTALFRFRSRQQGAELQCRLSGERVPRRLRAWQSCSSPKRYTRLRPGRKTFHVRAVVDVEAGKPNRHRWQIVKRRLGNRRR